MSLDLTDETGHLTVKLRFMFLTVFISCGCALFFIFTSVRFFLEMIKPCVNQRTAAVRVW